MGRGVVLSCKFLEEKFLAKNKQLQKSRVVQWSNCTDVDIESVGVSSTLFIFPSH